ncbi:MAG: hypothetical protein IT383_23325, partial [Deltaproteobacteria bacterium]|nr:hypothetical protein [Deltaproteobacteria bacterium]
MRCLALPALSFTVLAVACEVGDLDAHPAAAQQGLVAARECGNAVRENGEECDDGNTADGDGCSATCALEALLREGSACDPRETGACCGNDRVESGEYCDDGNGDDGDGCSSVCELEAGFTCFTIVSPVPQDVPPRFTRCAPRGCGDGIVNDGEGCDDWNLEGNDGCSSDCALESGFTCAEEVVVALPEVLGHRTVDCVSLACGDGSLDLGEGCDDGTANGQPGFCSTTCRSRMPLALVETDPYSFVEWPGVVGVIGSITLPDVLCLEDPPELGLYEERLGFLHDNAFMAGRIMVAREPFVVQSPYLILDDGVAPFDGRGALAMRTSMADVVYGSVEINAGERFVAPIAGAPSIGSCDWCGLGGFTDQDDFCFGGDGSPIGTGPVPGCPEGLTCPELGFRADRAISLGLPDLPGDPIGGGSQLTFSCDRSCLIAGPPELCLEPSGGGGELPGNAECISESIVDTRLCQQLGGGPLDDDIRNCLDGCEGRTGNDCPTIGFVEEDSLDLGCMFAACLEPGAGQCCTADDVPAFDSITDLSPGLAWMWCRLTADPTTCEILRLPPTLVPEELDYDVILQCSYDSLGDEDERRCRFCSHSFGDKCVVGSVPSGLARAGFQPASFAPEPAEEDSDEHEEQLALSAAAMRSRADPRRMEASADPIALLTGELVFEATDVELPSRGVPIAFTRSYRSGAHRSGVLGPGFTHVYEERIEVVADPDNTRDAPKFCTRALRDEDTATCLFHHDGHGGTTLFSFDAASGNYLPAPGGHGVIHVSVPDKAVRLGSTTGFAEVPTFFLTEPGGITRTFGASGVLLGVQDEMGYGVALEYDLLTPEEVRERGAWSSALPPGLVPVSTRSLAAGFAEHANPLNQRLLVGIEDSYGRKLALEYQSYFDEPADEAAGRERRHRLWRIMALDDEGGDAHVLVEYDYRTLASTNEAYLSKVTRFGLAGDLAHAEPVVVGYDRAHEIFGPGGALEVDLSGTQAQPVTTLGAAVDAALLRYGNQLRDCQLGLILPPADIDNACGMPVILEGAAVGGVTSTVSLWQVLQQHLADNIVRVRRAGEVELETRFGVNPLALDFDRAVEQRYGALPAPRTSPLEVREPGYADAIVHRWFTDMPGTLLRDIEEDELAPALQAAVPPVDHAPVPDNGSAAPEECQELNAAELPLFRLLDPVGVRSDGPSRTLARTKSGCAAIAARHARDIFAHDLTVLSGDDQQAGTRREQLEADLNLVCRFVEVKDREGASRVFGLNYSGIVLAEAAPSPAGGGLLAITRRRVNADGHIIEEIRPDCSATEVVWASDDDDGDGIDGGDGPNFQAGLALVRDEVSAIIERAPQDPARAHDPVCAAFAAQLDDPLAEDEDGVARIVTERRWVFTYEPVFQQMVSATGPDGITTIRRYDYQQLPANSRLAQELVERLAVRTGASVAMQYFHGTDYDGDGSLSETSAGLVLEAVRGVKLSSEERGDVGTRWQRNHAGRVMRQSTIADVDDPSADLDATHFRYYADLAHAERGDLGGNHICPDPQGPLAVTTRLRGHDTWDAADRSSEYVAYDGLGGVRLRRLNDDPETTEVTLRNTLGAVAEVEGPAGRHLRFTYDGRGQLVREEHLAAPMSVTTPRVRHLAWGLQGVLLGECVDLGPAGCEGFVDYAVFANEQARAGQSVAPPPFHGVASVSLWDREDRDVGRVDAEGGTTLLVRNQAGLVVAETVDGAPPLRRSYQHDVVGRVVSVATGKEANEDLEQFSRFDGFGRLVALQTLTPLAQSAFVEGAGSIERVRYDVMDREVGRYLEGDDGRGHRRLLTVSRVALNELGAVRHVHRAAAGLPPSLPMRPSGIASGDGFASEELGYDSALRPVWYRAEGSAHATTASYDGLGLRSVEGAVQAMTID